MSENKTKPTTTSVAAFIESVEDPRKRADSHTLLKMMQQATGEKPRMWGDSIVGFGDYHYKYDSGREGNWFLVGFSPRKQNLSVYLVYDLDRLDAELQKLGRHKRGKGCLYIKRLNDINQTVLARMIKKSAEFHRKQGKT